MIQVTIRSSLLVYIIPVIGHYTYGQGASAVEERTVCLVVLPFSATVAERNVVIKLRLDKTTADAEDAMRKDLNHGGLGGLRDSPCSIC